LKSTALLRAKQHSMPFAVRKFLQKNKEKLAEPRILVYLGGFNLCL